MAWVGFHHGSQSILVKEYTHLARGKEIYWLGGLQRLVFTILLKNIHTWQGGERNILGGWLQRLAFTTISCGSVPSKVGPIGEKEKPKY